LGTSSRSAAAKRLSAASLLFLCATVSPSTTHPHHHPYTQGTFTETVSIAFTLSFSHSTLTCHSHPHTIPCVPRSLTLNWPRLQILTGEDKDELLPLNLTEQGPSHSPLTVEWGLSLRYSGRIRYVRTWLATIAMQCVSDVVEPTLASLPPSFLGTRLRIAQIAT
jgi:hypothetical protein